MSPIYPDAMGQLRKRLIFYDPYVDGGSSAWFTYGRWILLGVIIAVAIATMLWLQYRSVRRVRMGASPIRGTGWMVPPSYYESQQQHEYPADVAPPYNPGVGASDAGYYDQHGNFVAKEHDAQYENVTSPQQGSSPMHDATDSFAPPPGPPPGHSDAATSSVHASEYYNPPQSPPPAKFR